MPTKYKKFILLLHVAITFYSEVGGLFIDFGGVLFLQLVLLSIGLLSIFHEQTPLKSYLIKTSIIFLVIGVFCLLSLLWSRAASYGASKILFSYLFFFNLILFTPYIYQFEKFYLNLWKTFSYGTLAFIIYQNGLDLFNFSSLDAFQRFGNSDNADKNPIMIGRFFALNSIVFLYCLYSENKNRILYTLVITLYFVLCILTGSKGVILGLTIGLIYLLIKKYRNSRLKFVLLSLIILITLSIIFSSRIEALLDNPFINSRFIDMSGSVKPREAAIQKGLEHITNSNFFNLLFGLGLGDFGYLIYSSDTRYYPHNIFIEVFYELGIFGLLTYFIFIIILLRYLYLNLELRTNTLRWSIKDIFAAFAFSYLLFTQTSGDLISNMYFFSSAATFISFYNTSKKQRLMLYPAPIDKTKSILNDQNKSRL